MTAIAFPSLHQTNSLAVRIESLRQRIVSAPSATELKQNATDVELVTAHLAGNPQAFSELVKRYTRPIYNVTYHFTNDVHEAENLTQETFLKAWNVMPRLALDKPLKPYFVKIAVNLCHDWAEKRKVANTVPFEAEGEMDFPDEASDPLQAVSDAELRARVRVKLEMLPPLYRTVIAMRYTEDMSYEDMAAALDVPVNTVRTHLHRAKSKLRALMETD